MRKILIAGNWKMYKTVEESVAFAKRLRQELPETEGITVAICPPFTSLSSVSEILRGSQIALGAQDVHFEEEGAFTGEVSPKMLVAAGCRYVIIGHSERRAYFSETNALIHQKLRASLRSGLTPILCVGERLEEREKGKTFEVVENHMSVLKGIEKEEVKKVVMAYEPVWAIGTGKTATPAQAQEVHVVLRKLLQTFYDAEVSQSTRILYGGSVKPENSEALVREADIDGALVGGASLEVPSFIKIIQGAQSKIKSGVQ
ncbi:MAG: triose-phosphate isomerase [Candidatus Omnitrophica bacterium]|nr:triose-phosphate isomerase [Candidatus Omnitrophota bacterium]